MKYIEQAMLINKTTTTKQRTQHPNKQNPLKYSLRKNELEMFMIEEKLIGSSLRLTDYTNKKKPPRIISWTSKQAWPDSCHPFTLRLLSNLFYSPTLFPAGWPQDGKLACT